MEPYVTPPCSANSTPKRAKLTRTCEDLTLNASELVTVMRPKPTFSIPRNLTQAMVEADPVLKRVQQDLLNLTSFNDNSTLCWRPSWFQKPASPEPFLRFWTLHNPPNVVTEPLSHRPLSQPTMTRRMRQVQDVDPIYLKSWDAWMRYCDLYSVPYDFLCEDQVRLLQLGLPRNAAGDLCESPMWPLYPEPLPYAQGSYILDTGSYRHLPLKFQKLLEPTYGETGEYVIVYSDGTMTIEKLDVPANAFMQGPGRRWSHVPWTVQQEKSCEPIKLKLKFWNSATSDSNVHAMDYN